VPRVIYFGSAWLASDSFDRTSTDSASSGRIASIRITQTTSFVGTPGYVAPEQADGAVGHPTADVYALGVVLYEALAGRPPFASKNWMDLLVQHAKNPVPPLLGVSKPLQAVVMAALAKAPAERIPSMADFHRELASVPEARP
jgi:serine/threonine protein kinase